MSNPGSGGRTGDESETGPTVVDSPQSKSRSKRKKSAPLTRGACLGRYVILDSLGRGGMGMVYKAYDPELGRQIAVKLVRVKGRHKKSAQERLLREAQALAQLSHPNVIAVYDVGTFGDDVFIAMELVDGVDVRQWLREATRSRPEVLKLFLAAGRGLDAAHSAGLVHRDFKPDNLVIGTDGRPRVIDFGLARVAGVHGDLEGDSETSYLESDSQTSGTAKNRLNTPLTQVGSVLGTPAYMAPEQHLGQDVDARSDQFSFCVSLYRALYGVRPFSGDDPKDLTQNVTQGRMDPPPKGPRVPRWIRRILLRGLSVAPEERYPSMAALLSQLQRDPAVIRKRVLRALAFAGVVAAIAFKVTSVAGDAPRCQNGRQQLDGVWDSEVRALTKQAFLATGRTHAPATFDLVDRRLNDYGDAWVDMYTESCKATNVRGDQSETLLDLRTLCLNRRLGKMAALTGLLSEATDPAVVDRAVSAATTLPELDACADEQALSSAVPRPESDSTWAAVGAARKSIDRAEAMGKAGDYQGALELATEIVDSVDEIDYAPVQAEALYLLGGNQRRRGKADEAEQTLYAAALMAAEARDDELAAKTWLELLWVVGYARAKPEQALQLRRLVEPAVVRAGSARRRGDLMNNLGAILRRKGKYPEARAHIEQALEIWTKLYGADDLQVSKAHNNLGNVLNDMGDFLEARKHHERVLEIRRAALGEQHPFVASALNNLGNSFMEQGEFEQARDHYQRSLDIAEKLDPTGKGAVMALNNLGNANADLGNLAAAQKLQERALAIQQGRENPDDADVGITINNLADLLLKQKKYLLARQNYEKSRDLFVRGLGEEHSYVAHATIGIGNALAGEEKHREAQPHFERALEIWRKAHGEDHATIAVAQAGLGRCDLAQGRAAQALERFAKSLSIREAAGGDALQIEVTRFELARAHWATGAKKRGLELAKQARAGLIKQPQRAKDELAEVDSWLGQREAAD